MLSNYLSAKELNVKTLKSGGYLNELYIQELIKTKSPYSASLAGGYILKAGVNHKEDGSTIIGVSNFHEGIATLFFDQNGKYEGSYKQDYIALKILNHQSFIVNYDDGSEYRMLWVDDNIGVYITSVTISGLYSNKEGYYYTFTPENIAKFPDKTFKFMLNLDFSDDDHSHENIPDCIINKSTKEIILFRINNDTLELFNKSHQEPFIMLKKIKEE